MTRRPRHWGLRTLAFLSLAAASTIAANALYAERNDDFVVLTFLGIWVGIIGAAVCSVQGLRGWFARPRA